MAVVSFNMAYRSFQGGSGRLDTRLDTPPSINRRHPNSCLARRPADRPKTRLRKRLAIVYVSASALALLANQSEYSGHEQFHAPMRLNKAILLSRKGVAL